MQIQSHTKEFTSPETLEKIWNAIGHSITISIADKNGNIIFVNDEFCRISKYSRSELLGKNHRILKSGFHPHEFFDIMWRDLSKGKIWRGDVKNMAKDGSTYWVKTTIVPILNESGCPVEFVSIRTNITEQKSNEEKLQQTLESLKSSDNKIQELKENIEFNEDFINIASHELKSPIQPILGFIELAKSGIIKNKDAWDGIQELATELSTLMDTVLEVSRVDRNSVQLSLESVSLNEFIHHIVYSIQPSIQSKISLEEKLDRDIEISIDKVRMSQVMRNLINNAIKFTPKGRIVVKSEIKEDQQSVEISIIDSGSGIDSKMTSKLFSKFATSEKDNKKLGTGLGLFLSKGLVEAHGGYIVGFNNHDDGATFRFSLPTC